MVKSGLEKSELQSYRLILKKDSLCIPEQTRLFCGRHFSGHFPKIKKPIEVTKLTLAKGSSMG